MKRRRIFALALAIALLALALTGCGSKDNGSAADGDTVTVKLGVVGAIYDDIWKPAQEALKAEGINLEIVQFSDYVTPTTPSPTARSTSTHSSTASICRVRLPTTAMRSRISATPSSRP